MTDADPLVDSKGIANLKTRLQISGNLTPPIIDAAVEAEELIIVGLSLIFANLPEKVAHIALADGAKILASRQPLIAPSSDHEKLLRSECFAIIDLADSEYLWSSAIEISSTILEAMFGL